MARFTPAQTQRPTLTFILAAILLFSLISWVLGCILTGKLLTDWAQREAASTKSLPYACTYFYSSTMPMISTIASGIELTILFTATPHFTMTVHASIARLVWPIIAFVAWLVQVSYWGSSQWNDLAGDPGVCDWVLIQNTDGSPNLESHSRYSARISLSTVVTVLYLAYLGVAAAQVHSRRTRGPPDGAFVLSRISDGLRVSTPQSSTTPDKTTTDARF